MSAGQILAGRAVVLISAIDGTGRMLDRIQSKMQSWGLRMSAIGGAALAPMMSSIFAGSDFDTQIRILDAVTDSAGETTEALAALQKQAMELGPARGINPLEVAKTQTELGKAGFTRAETLAMTPPTLSLARSSDSDPIASGEILGSTLRQFGLDATHAGKVADVLAMTVNRSAISLEDLGNSMKYFGPLAKGLGMSLEETAAFIGVLGNLGIKGEQAGTALRAIEIRAAAMAGEFKKVGITTTDAAGNLKAPVQIMRELLKIMDKMGTGERAATFAKLFGMRGMLGAVPINEDALGGISAFEDALKNSGGTANANAANIDAGPGGAIRRMKAEISALQIAIEQSLRPTVLGLLKQGHQLILWATQFAQKNPELLQTVFQLAAGLTALGLAVAGVGLAFSLLTSKTGLIVAALAALIAFFDEIGGGFEGLMSRMTERIAMGDVAGAWNEMIASMFRGYMELMDEISGGLVTLVNPGFRKDLQTIMNANAVILKNKREGMELDKKIEALRRKKLGIGNVGPMNDQPRDSGLSGAVSQFLTDRFKIRQPEAMKPILVQAATRIPEKLTNSLISPVERGTVAEAERRQKFQETTYLSTIAAAAKEANEIQGDSRDRIEDLLDEIKDLKNQIGLE